MQVHKKSTKYEPPDEVIRKNSATTNHYWDRDFKLIIHSDEL